MDLRFRSSAVPSTALAVALVACGWLVAGPPAQAVELLDLDGTSRVSCAGVGIDVGHPDSRWALGPGFQLAGGGEEERSYSWVDGRATILVPVAGGERSLRMTLLGVEEGMALRVRWNGQELDTQRLSGAWQTLVWDLPPGQPSKGQRDEGEAGGVPPAILELAADVRRQHPPDRCHVSFAVDRVWLVPAARCRPEAAVAPPPAAGGLKLAPGEALAARAPVLPRAVLALAARGEPGGTLTWAVGPPEGPWSSGSLRIDREGALSAEVTPGGCCSERGTVWLANRGPGAVTVESAELLGDDRPSAWRRECGSRLLEATALAAGLGLLWWLAGRRDEVSAGAARWQPWADAALVAGVAAALRFLYLDAFPVSEVTGFPDSHGYLNGARMLLSDEYSLWGDTHWHAWFSWIRPPGYYLFVAAVLGPLGAGVVTLAAIQTVLSALGAAALYSAGRSLFGRGVGLAAGLWLAIDPQAVTSASWVMSETLFLALLLPGIAALAACSKRPRGVTAVLAGLALGAAALVRSASLYFVPLAALLLWLVHRKRAVVPAAALVAAAALTVLPWSLRNQAIYGAWVGVDDIALHNFLVDHPNEEVVPLAGDDLDTLAGKTRYRRRVAWANNDRGLTRRRGELMRQGLARMARAPAAEAQRFAAMLRRSWSPAPMGYVGMVVGEDLTCRVARLTDLRNASIFVTLILGGLGMLLALRRRESWPVLLWPPFSLLAINLLFHPELRYAFTYLPVVMIFAAHALARLRPPSQLRPPAGRGA